MKERVSDLIYPYFVRFRQKKKRFRCRITELTNLKKQKKIKILNKKVSRKKWHFKC